MKPLTPYLFFAGNAREAVEFYKECFGGKLEVMTYADAPEDACPGGTKPTDDTKDKVMHACLTTGDLILMASDNPLGGPVVGDNISISIQPKDIPEPAAPGGLMCRIFSLTGAVGNFHSFCVKFS